MSDLVQFGYWLFELPLAVSVCLMALDARDAR